MELNFQTKWMLLFVKERWKVKANWWLMAVNEMTTSQQLKNDHSSAWKERRKPSNKMQILFNHQQGTSHWQFKKKNSGKMPNDLNQVIFDYIKYSQWHFDCEIPFKSNIIEWIEQWISRIIRAECKRQFNFWNWMKRSIIQRLGQPQKRPKRWHWHQWKKSTKLMENSKHNCR